MTLKPTLLAGAALASAMLLSSAASAAVVYDIHAKGTAQGAVRGIIYGGAPITVDATFDPANGTRNTNATLDQVSGFGANAPIDASVDLELMALTDWGKTFSSLSFFDAGANSVLSMTIQDPLSEFALFLIVNRPGDQFTSLDSFPLGEICVGANACFGGIFDPTAPTSSQAGLAFTSVSITSRVSAVPEPGTWALMITGFGLAGATLRRRRWSLAA